MSTVLALMLAQEPTWGDRETLAERNVRLETIAAAASIESAYPPEGWRWSALALTATLLATTFEEGQHWSLAVHSGAKTGDNGKARCLAQLHKHPTWVPGPMWIATTGVDFDATRLCMRGAARILAHYSKTCVSSSRARNLESSLARVVAGYGTGYTCSPYPNARARAKRAVRWLAELDAA